MDTAARTHPGAKELVRFMRGALPWPEVRAVVRHLLNGCPECLLVTRALWKLGDLPLRSLAAEPEGSKDREADESGRPRSPADGDLRKRSLP